MKKISKILLIITSFWAIIFGIDMLRIKKEQPPLFMINTTTYKDGGSKEYYGLFYKVIDYNIWNGYSKIHVGTWWMKYQENQSSSEIESSYTNLNYYKDILLKIDSNTSTNITYTIYNNSKKSIKYGVDYVIEYKKDNKWYSYEIEMSWDTHLETIVSEESITEEINFSELYENLDTGHYRFIKNIEGYNYSAEFDIK